MKILVVSDTHRRDGNLMETIQKEAPFDMLIHLGDAEGSDTMIEEWVGENCRLEMVLGNNDFFSMLDKEKEVKIGAYRVMLTHGHYYSVSLGTERILEEAKSRGVDMVMFGHTHKPLIEKKDGVWLLNPGSLSYPRQEGRKPSYMLMEIGQAGEPYIQICYVK